MSKKVVCDMEDVNKDSTSPSTKGGANVEGISNGTKTGTSIGQKGTSIGGQKTTGTSIGGGAKTAATSIGGNAKTAGTSIGGGAKTAGTSVGGGAKTAGTSVGGGAKTAGTSVGGGAKTAGTSIGGGAKTAATSIGGVPKPAGTSIGGAQKPAGTSIGGAQKPTGTSGNIAETSSSEESGESREATTPVGSEELGAVSLPATPKAGTSIGTAQKPAGTSIGGAQKPTGTSIGGAQKPAGTSIGGAQKPAGTSIGGTQKPAGTSIGGTQKPAGTSSDVSQPAEISIDVAPSETQKSTGTSLGGSQKSTGTSIGGAQKPAGTSIGGAQKPAGTSIGAQKPAETSTGGAPKPAGTSIGAQKPTGTSIGAQKPTGTSIGGAQKPAGTSIGAQKPLGTSVGGAPKPAATSLGGTVIGGVPKTPPTSADVETGTSEESVAVSPPATPKTTGTALGGQKTVGTSVGDTSGVKPTQKTVENPSTEQLEQDEAGEDDEGETEEVVGKKKRRKRKGAANQPDPQQSQDVKSQVSPSAAVPAKQPPKPKGPVSAAARQIKKMQEEQERIRREEEERRRKEEEEERRLIEEEKKKEEIRKKREEEKRAAREDQKKTQKEVETQKRREEAIRKYGFDPTQNVPRGGGGGARRGRGRGGPRGGRGGRDAPDDKPPEDNKSPEKPVEPLQKEPEKNVSEPPPSEVDDWEKLEQVINENEKIETNHGDDATEEKPQEKKPQDKNPQEEKPQEESKPAEKRKPNKNETKARRKEEKKEPREPPYQKTTFRSPICCVLGHVDTGKTLLLDKMRSSSVQAGEAGGITQQIGATYFPMSMIREMTIKVEESMKKDLKWKLPGLLVIDTPGHESFTNLRSRGSSLCDIAILVVDIMHGLEPQTRESINLLKKRRTPFVIALNKVDRLFGWNPIPGAGINQSLQQQSPSTKLEYDDRVKNTIGDLAGEGLNAELYYRNKEIRKVISLVPTSAVTGEGLPDLLLLLVQLSQNLMADKLLELSSLDCTVLEVKKLTGHGTTLDVVLANGVLKQGDRIMVCGLNGEPIITVIKAILLPPPATELRVKSEYINEKIVKASIGCKIDAPGLDDAVAGSPLFVINPGDNIEEYKRQVTAALSYLEGKVDRTGVGVYVQASTLGSMEALLEFLKEDCNIPVSGIRIGDVHKKDVMRASIMLEKNKPEYAVILAFDVKVNPEARQYAEQLRVRIFEAEIIYHLFKQFTDYVEERKEIKLEESKDVIVFPCILRILGKELVFNKRDPIICGVKVEEGILRLRTPIVVFSIEDKDKKTMIELGTITKIERERGVELQEAKMGDEVSICITVTDEKKQKYMFGRHFNETNLLYSHITREAIDALKEFHQDLVKQKEIYYCIKNLKNVLNIS